MHELNRWYTKPLLQLIQNTIYTKPLLAALNAYDKWPKEHTLDGAT